MNVNLKAHPVAIALAEVIALATDAKADASAAGTSKGKLIAKTRDAAAVAHAEGWNGERTAAAFAALAKVQEVPDGTVKPYRVALKGYVNALADGEAIATGYGTNGDKPMPAPVAREYAQYDAETRATRQRLKALVARISAAAKRMTDEAELTTLAEYAESVAPAADVKPQEAAPDLSAFFGEQAEAA